MPQGSRSADLFFVKYPEMYYNSYLNRGMDSFVFKVLKSDSHALILPTGGRVVKVGDSNGGSMDRVH